MTLAWHCGIHLNPILTKYRNLQKMRTWKHVHTRHELFACSSTYMRESDKREHWEWKTRFHTFHDQWECYALLTWAFVFSGFHSLKCLKSIDSFQSRSITKLRSFEERKPISSTFKALKSDSWNSRVLKGFQDAYEPCTLLQEFFLYISRELQIMPCPWSGSHEYTCTSFFTAYVTAEKKIIHWSEMQTLRPW